MNVEFHYYTTAFLALRAGFSLSDTEELAHACQYVDHHLRSWEINCGGTLRSFRPTQSYAFWDATTTREILAPFHFFPAGVEAARSVRLDGAVSTWDVRPHSVGVKALLVGALRSQNLYRIGIALHTYADTWAHQNFSSRTENWNHLDERYTFPSPGHAEAGWKPDLWLEKWTDPRLVKSAISNQERFLACAGKIYRYFCTALGRDFRHEETKVLSELDSLVDAGRGRDTVEERMLDFVLTLGISPYNRDRWITGVLEPIDSAWSTPPWLERWKQAGSEVLEKTGLMTVQKWKAKETFSSSPLAHWLEAAETHRKDALQWIRKNVEERL